MEIPIAGAFRSAATGTIDDTSDSVVVPSAQETALILDGKKGTCLNKELGGTSVGIPFLPRLYFGRDAQLSLDLGREYDVQSVKVFADPGQSNDNKISTWAMLSVFFSTVAGSTTKGECGKTAGLKVFNNQGTKKDTVCEEDCDCTSCPAASDVWPPDGTTMSQPIRSRFLLLDFEGTDTRNNCGIEYDKWFMSLCHVEVLVKFCDEGYFFDKPAGLCRLCPLGHYCRGGDTSLVASQSATPCPPRVFGDARGLSTPACNEPCGDGFDCSAGTVASRASVACLSRTKWCANGFGTNVQPGAFGAQDGNGRTVSQEPCGAGQYCTGGERFPVPAGYWSSRAINSDPNGEGVCEKGFFCPEGSTSARQVPCTNPTAFCPAGSSAAQATGTGFFAVRSTVGPFTVSTGEEICPVGTYCQGGVSISCPDGTTSTTQGQSSPQCDGPCPPGFACAPGGQAFKCGIGYYCGEGTVLRESVLPHKGRTPCPAGTFNDLTETGSSVAACAECPANRASNILAADALADCQECEFGSATPPGSLACVPFLRSVVAADDGADKTPGISDLDVVLFQFDRPTNTPAVDTDAKVRTVVRFEPSLSEVRLRGSWENQGRSLRVTLVLVPDSIDRFTTRPYALRAGIVDGVIQSADGLSAMVSQSAARPVAGDWGQSSQPVLSVAALVPAPKGSRMARLSEGAPLEPMEWPLIPLAGDRIVLGFDQPVRRVNISTPEDLDALLAWSRPPARAMSASFNARLTVLTLLVTDPHPLDAVNATAAAALRPGSLAVGILPSADLTSLDRSSRPCNDTAVVGGALRVVPSAVGAVQHSPASVLVRFQPPVLPPSAIDASTLASTGLTSPLVPTHVLLRWCSGSAWCDEAAVGLLAGAEAPDAEAGANNGTTGYPGGDGGGAQALALRPTTWALLPSTQHGAVAPGVSLRVWAAAVTSDGRVWPWVPAADAAPSLHNADAHADGTCAASPASRAPSGSDTTAEEAAAEAAGFRTALNGVTGCVCALEAEAMPHDVQPPPFNSDGTALATPPTHFDPLLGSPCDPTAPVHDAATALGLLCRCRLASSRAPSAAEARAEWFTPAAPLTAPCDAPAFAVESPAVIGAEAPAELSTEGGEVVRLHGRGLGLLPPGLRVSGDDHAAVAAILYSRNWAAGRAVRTASPLSAAELAELPGPLPPAGAAPATRLEALTHGSGAALRPLVGASVTSHDGVTTPLASCTIQCSQLVIRCTTLPGIGKDIVPSARIGATPAELLEDTVRARSDPGASSRELARLSLSDAGFESPPLCRMVSLDGLRACLRYGPPVIASFSGNGSADALTPGGQSVLVLGRQLGPRAAVANDSSLSVSYSPVGSDRVFSARGCSVTKDHEEMTCAMAPGAGGQLSWTVVVGRQKSVVPRTSYASPAITAVRPFRGAASEPWQVPDGPDPGLIAAWPGMLGTSALGTRGGDWVVVEGTNLGADASFVSRVAMVASGGPGVPPLELLLFAWTGEPVTRAAAGTLGGRPAPERCWMAVPHEVLLCRTLPGAGTGFGVEVAVLDVLSPRSSARLAYRPPSIAAVTQQVPTEGADRVEVRVANAPPDPTMVVLDVAGTNVTAFSMQALPDEPTSAVLIFSVPPLVGAVGAILSVPVRVAARGQSSSTSIAVRPLRVTRLDVDSIVRRFRVEESPPLNLATAAETVLLEVYGSSFGSDRSAINVTVAGEPCRMLSQAEIRDYVEGRAADNPHTTLVCWTTRRTGTVVVTGAPPIPGAQGISASLAYNYNEIKRAPTPLRAVPFPNVTSLSPLGGEFIVVRGTDLHRAGDLAVEFLLLDRSDQTRGPDESPVVASMPCVVPTRGQTAAMARDPCTAETTRVFTAGPANDDERSAICASPTAILCRTVAGRGASLYVRVISNTLAGVSTAAIVGYAAPQVLAVTPAVIGTEGGVNVTISLRNGGGRSLPPEVFVAAAATQQARDLARQGTVTIGGKPCAVVSWTDRAVVCEAPPGVAESPAVVVARDTSAVLPPGGFAYRGPVVFPISEALWPFEPEAIQAQGDNATLGRLREAERMAAVLPSAAATLANGLGPDDALYAFPTSGGVRLVVHGSNFGASPVVRLTRGVETGAGDVVSTQVACAPVPALSSHTRAVCDVGEGLGARINVTVDTGARTSVAPWRCHFERPSIASIRVDTLRVSPADFRTAVTPVVLGRSLTTEVDAGFRPAAGGFLLHIRGRSFSAAPRVTVGGFDCRIVFAEIGDGLFSGVGRIVATAPAPGELGTPAPGTVTADVGGTTIAAAWVLGHRSIVCAAPAGIGRSVPVVVSAGGLRSPSVPLDYDAPSLQLTVPGYATAALSPAEGQPQTPAATVLIQGASFGQEVSTPAAVARLAMRSGADAAADLLRELPAAGPGDVRADAPAYGYLLGPALGSDGVVLDVLFSPWLPDAASLAAALDAPADVAPPVMPSPLVFRRLCSAVTMPSPDAALQCTVSRDASVGVGLLTVRVADAAAAPRGVLILCPAGWYSGGIGQSCLPCPEGAICPGGFVEPLPQPSFFKRGRTGFAECMPRAACRGFVEGSVSFPFGDVQLGSDASRYVRGADATAVPGQAARALQDESAAAAQASADRVLLDIEAAWRGTGPAVTALFPPGGPVVRAWADAQELNALALRSQCSSGYAGDRCSVCSRKFYRLEADCIACPDLGWLYMLIGGCAIVLLAGLAYLLHRSQINLSGASVGVDFLQSVALFATLGFRWPVELRIALQTLGSANLNLQLLAPSCTVEWSAEIQFYLIVALPLGCTIAAIFAAAFVRAAQLVWRCARSLCCAGAARGRGNGSTTAIGTSTLATRRKSGVGGGAAAAGEDSSVVDLILGAAFSILYFAYLTVCRTSIQWFDCFPVSRPDGSPGELVLDVDPSIVCDTSVSPVYARVLPLAYVSTVVYGAGVPIVFTVILWIYKAEITADQVLRERGEGNSPRTNPNFAVRKRFGRIYSDFRAGFTTWRVVLLLRKLALVAVALLFSREALFAGTLSVLILFLSYAAHTKYKPFLATAALSKEFLKLAEDEEEAGGIEAKDLLRGRSVGKQRPGRAPRSRSAGRPVARSASGGRPARSGLGDVHERGAGSPRSGPGGRAGGKPASGGGAWSGTIAILARIGRVLCPVMVLCLNDADAKRRLRMRQAVRRARRRRASLAAGESGRKSFRRATLAFKEMQGKGLITEAEGRKAQQGQCLHSWFRCLCCCCVCCCGRAAPKDLDSLGKDELRELAALAAESSLGYQFDYNALESSYLSSSITILVGGMVFSTVELVHGSVEYVLLTTFLSLIILSAGLSFLYLLLFELYRSVRFAHVFSIARQYEDRLRSDTTAMSKHIKGIDVVFKRADRDASRLAEVGRLLAASSSGRAASASPRSGEGAGAGAGRRASGGGGIAKSARLAKFHRAAAKAAAGTAGTSGTSGTGPASGLVPSAGLRQRAGSTTTAPAIAPPDAERPSTPRPAASGAFSMSDIAGAALERLRAEQEASSAGVRSGRAAKHNTLALMARAASESGSVIQVLRAAPPKPQSSRRVGGRRRVAGALLRTRSAHGPGGMLAASVSTDSTASSRLGDTLVPLASPGSDQAVRPASAVTRSSPLAAVVATTRGRDDGFATAEPVDSKQSPLRKGLLPALAGAEDEARVDATSAADSSDDDDNDDDDDAASGDNVTDADTGGPEQP